MEAVAEKHPKASISHHVFKKHYSSLGQALGTSVSIVASHLYSSNLISPGTKGKVTADGSTTPFDKSLAILDDVEGRIDSNEQVFEKFLNVLCCDQVDLGHVAEPMRLEYQQLCESSTGLVVGNENSRFVAPGLSLSSSQVTHSRRVEGVDSSHCEIQMSQESRPKHLHFSKLAEDEAGKQVLQTSSPNVPYQVRECSSLSVVERNVERSLAPPEMVRPLTSRNESVAWHREELNKSLQRYLDSIEGASRQECEEKVESLKKQYETEMEAVKKAHGDKVDSLLDTIQISTGKCSDQKEKIQQMEKELDSIHSEFTAKSKEVEELRQTLANREAELDRMKTLMNLKQKELRQLKGNEDEPVGSPVTKRRFELQMYQGQIALCEEIQSILVQFRDCSPDKVASLKRELKQKIEEIASIKKKRWKTL